MNSEQKIYGIIGFFSVVVISFLFWLIYFKTSADVDGQEWVSYLPAINAFLNTLTSLFLVTGYIAIKRNNKELHKKLMLVATATSACFLVSYVIYHHFQGDTKFTGVGVIRPIYFAILISHILLSIVQVPLILTTLYFAFTQKFVKHRKISRITLPVWLYVSITGVLIFVILNTFS